MTSTLYHVHDPMCSWCWGYRRSWDGLRAQLPASLVVQNIVGGLAPDTDKAMPVQQQEQIAGYWREVSAQTGAEFNFEFWQRCQPRRSTYPACRAVLAADEHDKEQAMIDAIQQAYYLRALNPSDDDVLASLAGEIGLDETEFLRSLHSPQIQARLEQEFALRRKLGVFSFPSLVLEHHDRQHPIEINYRDHRPTLRAIQSLLGSDGHHL